MTAPFPARVQGSAAAASTATSNLRLTNRGRVLLLLVTILTLFTVVVASGRFTAQATVNSDMAGESAPATAVVVVQAGESLWSIAQQVAPGTDPREMVSRIRDLNGLADAVVSPGQSLLVPRLR
ncbi:MAG: LysM peptidoglycan-binding domain-containing protein [Actinobacteria bacterium]|nr:LysM peptidoglycan-binding domain-containing protein [Actinomycetota bacterium]